MDNCLTKFRLGVRSNYSPTTCVTGVENYVKCICLLYKLLTTNLFIIPEFFSLGSRHFCFVASTVFNVLTDRRYPDCNLLFALFTLIRTVESKVEFFFRL